MKTLITFLLCFIFHATVFSQDLFVKADGEKVECKIVDVDSAFIYFKKGDTTIYKIQKQELIATKLENEKMVFFFIPDTLFTHNGNRIICKVIGLVPTAVTYIPVDSTLGKVTVGNNKNFTRIQFGDGSRQFIEKNGDYSSSKFSQNVKNFQLGEADADEYYKTNPHVAVGVLCGLTTYAFGAGIVFIAIACAVPPIELKNPANPNNNSLKTNRDYYEGYRNEAKHLKRQNLGYGYLLGVVVPIAIVIIIFQD